jgi:hypothetical protein
MIMARAKFASVLRWFIKLVSAADTLKNTNAYTFRVWSGGGGATAVAVDDEPVLTLARLLLVSIVALTN